MWDPSMCFGIEIDSSTVSRSTEQFGLAATVPLPKYCKLKLEFKNGWLNAIAMVDPSPTYERNPVPYKVGKTMTSLREHWEDADFVEFNNDRFEICGLVDIMIKPSQLHATFNDDGTKREFVLSGFPSDSRLAVGMYRGNEVHILHCEAMLWEMRKPYFLMLMLLIKNRASAKDDDGSKDVLYTLSRLPWDIVETTFQF
eukprot:PhF_6_TR16937/c3_g3_i6/m.25495